MAKVIETVRSTKKPFLWGVGDKAMGKGIKGAHIEHIGNVPLRRKKNSPKNKRT